MKRERLFRAKCIDKTSLKGAWLEGDILQDYVTGKYFIHMAGAGLNESDYVEGLLQFIAYEIDPETICRCTEKEYMDCDTAYEGDIFESQSCGLRMVLKYGTYQAYCPADKCYMDSVGFYAEAPGYPPMPIRALKNYALKIGNIFDNPELLEVQNA